MTDDIDDYNMINYCSAVGISKAQLIVKAIRYCIDHNINLMENITDE